MTLLATTSLSPTERRVLGQFIRLLQAELGDDLRAVWLYGSRAGGGQPGPDSDVDLLVVSTRRRANDDLRVIELLMDAARAEGANPALFSAKLFDPDRIAERRGPFPIRTRLRTYSFVLHAGGRPRQGRPLRRAVNPRMLGA